MSNMPRVKIAKPIESLKVVDTPGIVIEAPATEDNAVQGTPAGLETQQPHQGQSFETVGAIVSNLQFVYEKAILEHRQAIAKLAVEIARKILMQKVKDGDYQIESIIQEALNNAPTRQDIVVRLNPQDLAQCQQLQQDGQAGFAGIKLVGDAGIGPAQCVIETPKGKVESLIDEHLDQVGRALSKAV